MFVQKFGGDEHPFNPSYFDANYRVPPGQVFTPGVGEKRLAAQCLCGHS